MVETSMTSSVFEAGKHVVVELRIEPNISSSSSAPPPPKPLLIATPTEEGEYPVLVLLHGYFLLNDFYSQLLRHVASHGFIVLAPQLYKVTGQDATGEIKDVAAVTNWLPNGLPYFLPTNVQPNLHKLALAGHSRGGKVSFAFALGDENTSLKFSALIGIDPVDGKDKDNQTTPPVLTYVPHSFNLNMPVLVVGTGLGELKKNPLFCACAPKGVNHEEFFNECCIPAWYFVARDYGHMDMLDDETKGITGIASYCLCKNGETREPMRRFVGGVVVAFMKAYLEDDFEDLTALKKDPEIAPVVLSKIECLL